MTRFEVERKIRHEMGTRIESGQRVLQAIESLTEGFALFDNEDRLILFNERYRALYGPVMHDVIRVGVRFEEIIRKGLEADLIPAARGREDAWVAERLKRHQRPTCSFEHQLSDGRWIHVSEIPMEQGGLVAIRRDITQKRNMEQALQARLEQMEVANCRLEEQKREIESLAKDLTRAQKAAEVSARAKSEFLATMSHEIRTPMNGIVGLAGLLSTSPLTAHQRLWVESIRQSGKALLRIVNDILDMSRLETGKIELQTTPFDPRDILENILELLSPRAHEKSLRLLGSCHRDLPARVCGDSGRLRQILMNLVGNAIKFSEKGAVIVHCLPVPEPMIQTPSSRLRFEILDRGIGIPEGARAQLFERFVQADSSTSRRYGGSGLGLAICKELVEMMGGTIGARPRSGGGSLFWFEVVLDRDMSTSHPEGGNEVEGAEGKEGEGLRLLLSDTCPLSGDDSLEVLAALFRDHGAHVDIAGVPETSGAAKRKDSSSERIDAVLVMKPLEGLGEDKPAIPPYSGAPMVLIGPREDQPDEDSLWARGFASYLGMPLTREAITDTLTLVREMRNGRCASRHGVQPLPLADARPTPGPVEQTLTGREAAPRAPLASDKTADKTADKGKMPFRVLVAEDNHINQLLLSALLKRMGHHVECVANGLEAIEAVRTLPFDVVLMDVRMPEMDGFRATAGIRAMPPPRNRIPIIAVTANAMAGDAERCLAHGMNDYLSKPIDSEKLEALIDEWGQKESPDLPGLEGGIDTTGGTRHGIGTSLDGTSLNSDEMAGDPPDGEALSEQAWNCSLSGMAPKMAAMLIPACGRDLRNTLAAAMRLRDCGDFDSLAKRAETLKSIAGTLGAWPLYKASVRLGRALVDRDRERLDLCLNEVRRFGHELARNLESKGAEWRDHAGSEPPSPS